MSCKKAQGFLEQNECEVADITDAGKERKGAEEALRLARSAERVVVGKGKKVTVFDMKKAPPSDEELLKVILGPTGNLKAPTLRLGRTLLVGFSEEMYRQTFGG